MQNNTQPTTKRVLRVTRGPAVGLLTVTAAGLIGGLVALGLGTQQAAPRQPVEVRQVADTATATTETTAPETTTATATPSSSTPSTTSERTITTTLEPAPAQTIAEQPRVAPPATTVQPTVRASALPEGAPFTPLAPILPPAPNRPSGTLPGPAPTTR